MAISPYMILYSKNVAILPYDISLTGTMNGITGFGTDNFKGKFGLVQLTNPQCERVSVGNYVGFTDENAMLVTVGVEQFYIVDEANIKFKQIPPTIIP
jgi:hypothetical protein